MPSKFGLTVLNGFHSLKFYSSYHLMLILVSSKHCSNWRATVESIMVPRVTRGRGLLVASLSTSRPHWSIQSASSPFHTAAYRRILGELHRYLLSQSSKD